MAGHGQLLLGLYKPLQRAGVNRLEQNLHDTAAALAHVGAKRALHWRAGPGAGASQHGSCRFDERTLQFASADGANGRLFREQHPAAGVPGGRAAFVGHHRKHAALAAMDAVKCRINPVGGTWQGADHEMDEPARCRS